MYKLLLLLLFPFFILNAFYEEELKNKWERVCKEVCPDHKFFLLKDIDNTLVKNWEKIKKGDQILILTFSSYFGEEKLIFGRKSEENLPLLDKRFFKDNFDLLFYEPFTDIACFIDEKEYVDFMHKYLDKKKSITDQIGVYRFPVKYFILCIKKI